MFKRDHFTCAYCGQTPPNVILEVDHIIPKFEGGEDVLNNLVTSCFDCNRGKGRNSLESIPEGISDQIKIREEKAMQIKELEKLIRKEKAQYLKKAEVINNLYRKQFEGWELSGHFINGSLRKFFQKLLPIDIEESMEIALSKFPCTRYNKENTRKDCIRYFCGICHCKIRELNNEQK